MHDKLQLSIKSHPQYNIAWTTMETESAPVAYQ